MGLCWWLRSKLSEKNRADSCRPACAWSLGPGAWGLRPGAWASQKIWALPPGAWRHEPGAGAKV